MPRVDVDVLLVGLGPTGAVLARCSEPERVDDEVAFDPNLRARMGQAMWSARAPDWASLGRGHERQGGADGAAG